MDSLFVSHQPLLSFPFSFLPPSSSSSSLCSSTNRATPALLPTSPLSSSSLLHVYTLKGSTEPTGPTPNTNTLVLTLPELLPQLPAKLNSSSFFFFFSCFSCFWHKTLEFLSLPLSLSRRLLLSSSCQVDISFISQEVFDRPFYEEMYPPAAPIATAQLQYIFPSRTDSHRRFNFHPFFSLHHSGPFHFTFLFLFLFCCFLLFLIKISSNVWSSTWKRDSLYFVSSLW